MVSKRPENYESLVTSFQDHWDHWEQRKSVKTKAFAKAHPKKMPLNIYIIIIIQKIVPKEISLHINPSKKITNSPKPHSPERSTWSRPDVADRAQDVDTGAEVPRGEVPQGAWGWWVQPSKNGDLTIENCDLTI